MTWTVAWRPSERDFLVRRADLTGPTIVVRAETLAGERGRAEADVAAHAIAGALERLDRDLADARERITFDGEEMMPMEGAPTEPGP